MDSFAPIGDIRDDKKAPGNQRCDFRGLFRYVQMQVGYMQMLVRNVHILAADYHLPRSSRYFFTLPARALSSSYLRASCALALAASLSLSSSYQAM